MGQHYIRSKRAIEAGQQTIGEHVVETIPAFTRARSPKFANDSF